MNEINFQTVFWFIFSRYVSYVGIYLHTHINILFHKIRAFMIVKFYRKKLDSTSIFYGLVILKPSCMNGFIFQKTLLFKSSVRIHETGLNPPLFRSKLYSVFYTFALIISSVVLSSFSNNYILK